jgi:hypothetical protein
MEETNNKRTSPLVDRLLESTLPLFVAQSRQSESVKLRPEGVINSGKKQTSGNSHI